MNTSSSGNPSGRPSHSGSPAWIRLIPILLIFFLLGVAATYVAMRQSPPDLPESQSPGATSLSTPTTAVLQRLTSPVEIRFYSLLDPATVPASLRDFSKRVDQLLSKFASQSNGKIRVARYDTPSDPNADLASADGLQAFNREKGDASFLGLAVVQNNQKETLPLLTPEWEQALEFDLSRAIARVTSPQPKKASPQLGGPQTDAPTVREIRRLLPNLDSLSLDQAKQILRASTLEEFKKTAAEMDTQVQQAQQRLAAAQQANSESELQAARAELMRLQEQQAAKLQSLAIDLQSRIETLEWIKSQAPK